jgi:hypothetical protein
VPVRVAGVEAVGENVDGRRLKERGGKEQSLSSMGETKTESNVGTFKVGSWKVRGAGLDKRA